MKGKATAKKAAKKTPATVRKSPVAKKASKKAAKKTPKAKSHTEVEASDVWNLRLYVAGQTPKSLTAFSNLKKLCEQHLPGKYNIEVVDLAREPHRAQADQIVALPTLVRKLPEPIKRVIGDLSNTEKVQFGLDLQQKL